MSGGKVVTFEEHVLADEANEYVRDCLEYGHSLSRYLRHRPDLAHGKVIVRLPLGADVEDLDRFEWGGKYPKASDGQFKPQAEQDLAFLIRRFLQEGKGRACVSENYLARRTDPWLAHAKSRILFFGEEVYHVIDRQDVESDSIDAAIREAESPTIFVGVLSTLRQGFRLPPVKTDMDTDQLRVLAEEAEKLIVRAYDGEGYLIWNKP